MQDTPPTDPPLLGAAIQSEHETEDERGDRTFDGMNKDLAIIMHQARAEFASGVEYAKSSLREMGVTMTKLTFGFRAAFAMVKNEVKGLIQDWKLERMDPNFDASRSTLENPTEAMHNYNTSMLRSNENQDLAPLVFWKHWELVLLHIGRVKAAVDQHASRQVYFYDGGINIQTWSEEQRPNPQAQGEFAVLREENAKMSQEYTELAKAAYEKMACGAGGISALRKQFIDLQNEWEEIVVRVQWGDLKG